MQRARWGWLRRLSAGLVCTLAAGGIGVVFASPAAAARPCSAGLVVLTFDDGPSASQTPRLVKILREKKVPATFFMVGERVRNAPAVARLVQRSGFGIANHTWSHPLLTTLSDRAVRDQVIATGREFRRHGIVPGPLMRPPYGAINQRVRRDIDGTGLVPVLWQIDSQDWAGGNARQIANRILAQLRPRQTNIVLQHDGVDNSPNSIGAVPLVVSDARRRGYCFTDLNDNGLMRVPVPKAKARIIDGSERGNYNGTSPVRVLLTLDRPTTRAVSFRFRTVALSATSGVDYYPVTMRVGFAPGETERAVRVRVLEDGLAEPTESFRAYLDAATGVKLPRPQYLAHAADDDEPVTPVPPTPFVTPFVTPSATPGVAAAPAPESFRVLGPPVRILPFDPWLQLR